MFLFIPMDLVSSDKRVISIFDHMLSSFILKHNLHLRPFLALLSHVFYNLPIFLEGPIPFHLALIKMVEPPLTAIFGTDKLLPSTAHENLYGDLCPPARNAKSKLMQIYLTASVSRLSSFSVQVTLSVTLKRLRNWNSRNQGDLPKNIRDIVLKLIFYLQSVGDSRVEYSFQRQYAQMTINHTKSRFSYSCHPWAQAVNYLLSLYLTQSKTYRWRRFQYIISAFSGESLPILQGLQSKVMSQRSSIFQKCDWFLILLAYLSSKFSSQSNISNQIIIITSLSLRKKISKIQRSNNFPGLWLIIYWPAHYSSIQLLRNLLIATSNTFSISLIKYRVSCAFKKQNGPRHCEVARKKISQQNAIRSFWELALSLNFFSIFHCFQSVGRKLAQPMSLENDFIRQLFTFSARILIISCSEARFHSLKDSSTLSAHPPPLAMPAPTNKSLGLRNFYLFFVFCNNYNRKLEIQKLININMMQQSSNSPPCARPPPSHHCPPPSSTVSNTLANRIRQNYEAIEWQKKECRSRSRGRLRKVKTPSEILKENILKNRQSRKVTGLKCITEQNLKLFRRLQDQKSSYEFKTLHYSHSCTVLPLAKSAINAQPANPQRLAGGPTSRCSISLRKSSSQSIQNNYPTATPTHSTSRIHPKIDSSKLAILKFKDNKENLLGDLANKMSILEAKPAQGLIKTGIKLNLEGIKVENKKNFICQQIMDIELPLSFRSAKTNSQSNRGLTERKLEVNI